MIFEYSMKTKNLTFTIFEINYFYNMCNSYLFYDFIGILKYNIILIGMEQLLITITIFVVLL